MKAVRVFGVLVAIVQLASMLAFGASLYTILTVASSNATGDAMTVEVAFDEATGSGVLRLDATTRNEGLLGVDLDMWVYALNDAGERFARNSTSVHLDVGEVRPVSLSLRLPGGLIKRVFEDGVGCLEVSMDLRTLNGLVGVSNTMTVGGGEPR